MKGGKSKTHDDMKTLQIFSMVSMVVAALLLAMIAYGIFRARTTETPGSLSGAYELVFYAQSSEEAELRVAERYNSRPRRLVLMDGGNYYLFEGTGVEAGKWSLKGERLTVGKAEYGVTPIPGALALDNGTYLLLMAWKK